MTINISPEIRFNWNLERPFSTCGCVTSKVNTLLYSVKYLGLKQLNGFQTRRETYWTYFYVHAFCVSPLFTR